MPRVVPVTVTRLAVAKTRRSATRCTLVLSALASPATQLRIAETGERWRETFGAPDETQHALGRALSERIREYAATPPPAPPEPPTRWTRYRPGASPEVIKLAA